MSVTVLAVDIIIRNFESSSCFANVTTLAVKRQFLCLVQANIDRTHLFPRDLS